jgi:phage/plasmid-like protein (TIGR03299 family)
MADNIDTSNGRDNVAWTGERSAVWHRKGSQMLPGASIEDWARVSGLDYEVASADAYMAVGGNLVKVDGYRHLYRKDTGVELGYVTDVYKEVQPIEQLRWLFEQINNDDRFEMDVAGALRGGRVVWATAKFREPMTVAGDKHIARLLMSTSYDKSYATDNRATMLRVVCNNVLDAALARDAKASVKTKHNSKWDSKKVSLQLGDIISQFASYKAMGDAMVQVRMTQEANELFIRRCLGIKDGEEVNTRKENMLHEVRHAYDLTVAEGTEPNTAWTALNAVTRYVDHNRGTRDTGDGEVNSRFFSAQFGSGAAMKAKAVSELYKHNDGELANLLKVPLITRTERPFDQPLVTRVN